MSTRPTIAETGHAPESSYWIGCDRAELARRIAARLPQMARANWKTGLAWDNSIEAEATLRRRLAACKARAADRRSEAERLRGW